MRTILGLVAASAAMLSGIASADVMSANKRAKAKSFDAAGDIRCAQEVGQELGPCSAEVARVEGSAAVVVTFPNGFRRTLTFSDGEFLRGNATMSGVGTDTEWERVDDLYLVRVDDQRFEIPAALVFGE